MSPYLIACGFICIMESSRKCLRVLCIVIARLRGNASLIKRLNLKKKINICKEVIR